MSLRPAAEVAREWFYNADYPNECASQAEVDDLAALVERVRAEALQAAAEVAQRFDPALDPGILPLRILGPIPARLDPEGTAKGKTILTAEMVGHNGPVPWPGPASTHVDIETGKRTALGDDPCGSCGHPLAGHLAGYGCGAGGGGCKCPVGQ